MSIEKKRQAKTRPLSLFRFSLSLSFHLFLVRTLDAAAMPKQLQLQSMLMNAWRARKRDSKKRERVLDGLLFFFFANRSFFSMLLFFLSKKKSAPCSGLSFLPLPLIPALSGAGARAEKRERKTGKNARRRRNEEGEERESDFASLFFFFSFFLVTNFSVPTTPAPRPRLSR